MLLVSLCSVSMWRTAAATALSMTWQAKCSSLRRSCGFV